MAASRRSAFHAARAAGGESTPSPSRASAGTGGGLIQAYEDARDNEDTLAVAASDANDALAAGRETTDSASAALAAGLATSGPRLKRDATGEWIVWQAAPGDPGFVSFPITEGDLEESAPTPNPTPPSEPEPEPTLRPA
jgi:hypothetical protein